MTRQATFFAALLAMFLTPVTGLGQSAAKPSLASELKEKADQFAQTAPKELLEVFNQGVEDVRRLGLVETAKNVGATAPNGVLLTDSEGQEVSLGSLFAEGPIVLSFYRGGWCPYCNLQLQAMQRSLSEIEGAGARLVAVAPELPEQVSETTAKNELTFLVLSDRNNRLARAFGVVFELPDVIRPIYEQRIGLAKFNGNDDAELPLAATYVIDRQGVIRWAFLDPDYRKRAEPSDVIAAVKSLE